MSSLVVDDDVEMMDYRSSARLKNNINLELWEKAIDNLDNKGYFICMHGGPIDSDLENRIGERVNHSFICPDNCIVVVVSQPGVVQFANEDIDKEAWSFFKQRYWPAAGIVTGTYENCYGADAVPSGLDKPQAREYHDEFFKEEKEKIYNGYPNFLNKNKDLSIGERVSTYKEYKREKQEDKKDDANNLAKKRKAGIDYKDWITFIDHPARYNKINTNPKNNADGQEVLSSVQIFFPGDEIYNQRHDFETEKIGGFYRNRIDFNFDIFKLGKSTNTYVESQLESPINTFLYELTGKPIYKNTWYGDYRINQDKNHSWIVYPNQLSIDDEDDEKHAYFNDNNNAVEFDKRKKKWKSEKSYIHPTWNALKYARDGDTPAEIATTERLVNTLLYEDGGTPTIIVINSCSPYKASSYMRRNLSRGFDIAIQNLVLRDKIYKTGRSNFCKLRNIYRNKSFLVNLPQLEDHKGYTRRDKDDRREFYVILGNHFKEKKGY